jgi:hypothetical protein
MPPELPHRYRKVTWVSRRAAPVGSRGLNRGIHISCLSFHGIVHVESLLTAVPICLKDYGDLFSFHQASVFSLPYFKRAVSLQSVHVIGP